MNTDKNNRKKSNRKLYKLIFYLSLLLIFLGILLTYRVIVEKVLFNYLDSQVDGNILLSTDSEASSIELDFNKPIIQSSSDKFGIIIPKLRINSVVIKDSSNETSLETKDSVVYHLGRSFLPNESGNTVIYPHPYRGVFSYPNNNATFYNTTNLERGDVIYLVYEEQIYKFIVKDKRRELITSSEVMINEDNNNKTLYLLSNYIPGINLIKYQVKAELDEIN